jgi:hypothetical protein
MSNIVLGVSENGFSKEYSYDNGKYSPTTLGITTLSIMIFS